MSTMVTAIWTRTSPELGNFDRYWAEPETFPPECAANQHGCRGREDQSGDEAERFIRYPIELGDLMGPKRQPEADRLGGTDAEGGGYIDRDVRDLARGQPRQRGRCDNARHRPTLPRNR
jgi:hypothetical protein